MIVENKSYQLNRVQIYHYLGKTELNFPHFGASAEEIDDLLEVSMSHNNDDTTDLHSVTISSQSQNSRQHSPALIAGKTCPATQTTPLLTANNGERNKNPATIKHQPNSLLRTVVATGEQYTLKAHNEMLANIVPSCNNITQELLLDAPSFNITFYKFHIITNVTHQ